MKSWNIFFLFIELFLALFKRSCISQNGGSYVPILVNPNLDKNVRQDTPKLSQRKKKTEELNRAEFVSLKNKNRKKNETKQQSK
jgi:hypothetical protein